MTRGLRLPRRAGPAAALTAALLVLSSGTPAGAEPAITVTTPADGATVDNATVAISGRAQATTGLVPSSLTSVTLTLAGMSTTVACPSSPCSFTWSPSVPTNGRYALKVSATEQPILGASATSTLSRTVIVDAPPARPSLDPPRVTDSRTVELTWSRNTEPDMIFYTVARKDPAGGSFLPIGRVDQPASGKSVVFTDTTTNLNGGAYGYQVVAVRKGAEKPEAVSGASSPQTATVPAPPASTIAAPAPGAARGSTTTVKAGAAAGVDLSGFLSSRAQPTPAPPTTVIEPPDPGFKGTLPFGSGPATDQVEEGDAQAVTPATGRSPSVVGLGRARPFVPVAAGLVLVLLATHLRLLNRRLKLTTGSDLPIEAAAAPLPPPPARLVRGTGPEVSEPEGPRPEEPEMAVAAGSPATFYDASDDEDWDAERPSNDAEPAPVLREVEESDGRPAAAGAAAARFDPKPYPVANIDDDLEPEPVVLLEPGFDLHLDPVVMPVAGPDMDPRADVRPAPALDVQPDLGEEAEHEVMPKPEPEPGPEPAPPLSEAELDALEAQFEVMEVISPVRRSLVRSGRR